LLVQLDLAAHNVRDEVCKHLEVAQNVFLADRSQRATARRNADSKLKSTREGSNSSSMISNNWPVTRWKPWYDGPTMSDLVRPAAHLRPVSIGSVQ